MSGIEYYHIKGYMAPTANPSDKMEAELDMPTAPMYKDLDSYSGRCAVWLKYFSVASISGTQTGILRNFMDTTTPTLLMRGCPSLNQLTLRVNRGQNWLDGTSPLALGAGAFARDTEGGFRDAQFTIPFNYSHMEFTTEAGILVGDIKHFPAADGDGGVAGGTGDGTGNNAPAASTLIDNAKYFTEYYNPNCGNMADAVIVNNLWGKRQIFTFCGLRKNKFNAGQIEHILNYEGDCSFELVIQPLKNEPIYRGLPDDEKQRRV